MKQTKKMIINICILATVLIAIYYDNIQNFELAYRAWIIVILFSLYQVHNAYKSMELSEKNKHDARYIELAILISIAILGIIAIRDENWKSATEIWHLASMLYLLYLFILQNLDNILKIKKKYKRTDKPSLQDHINNIQ